MLLEDHKISTEMVNKFSLIIILSETHELFTDITDINEDVNEGKDKTVKPLAGLLRMEKSLL